MNQAELKHLTQWRRYEFIRDFGLENAEQNPEACVRALVTAGFFRDTRSMRGKINGVRTVCREMRKGWKPKPIEASPRDVMELLCRNVTSGPPVRLELSPDESALIWSAVQNWKRTHQ